MPISHPGVAGLDAPDSPLSFLQAARSPAQAATWIKANSFAPTWLPARWRTALVAYALAAASVVATALLTVLLRHLFPSFPYPALLAVLAVLAIALNWGAGPALLAALLAAILETALLYGPRLGWGLADVDYLAAAALYVGAAGLIGGVASRERAWRLRAWDLAESLCLAAQEATARANQLEAIIDAIPDSVGLHDAQGAIVRLNRAGRSALGGDQHGEPLRDLPRAFGVHRLSGELIAAEDLPVARVLRGEPTASEELVMRYQGGGDQHRLARAAPWFDGQGRLAGVVTVTHDVTALRQAERAAEARAREVEAVFEAMADGVFLFGPAGEVLRLNGAARALFGMEGPLAAYAAPLAERGHHTAVRDAQDGPLAEGEWPLFRVLRGEVLAGEGAADLLVRTRAGREWALSVTGAPVRDAAGAIGGAVCVVRDVTERRRLERRTHQALAALLAMAQAVALSPADVAAVGEDRWTAAQAVARRMADLTREVLGCSRVGISAVAWDEARLQPLAVAGLSPEDERRWWAESGSAPLGGDPEGEGLVARLGAGEVLALDLTLPPFDGRPNPFGVRTLLVAPLRLGVELIGIMALDHGGAAHDYTPDERALAAAVADLAALVIERERLLHERAQGQARELALGEANRRMDQFLAMASHELRTPLAGINGAVQLASRRLERLAARPGGEGADLPALLAPVQDLLESIRGQARRQNRLIGDLLDASRIQAGTFTLQPEPCDLAAVVREAVEVQRRANPGRAIALAPEGGRRIAVVADADRLDQVATNLLTNALRYAPAGRPIEVAVVVEGGQARVSVSDHGPGLAVADQERIWGRFYRGEEGRAAAVGLGLGLYISRTIVEQHGGRIGVESAPGEGATFWFTLPLARDGAGGGPG